MIVLVLGFMDELVVDGDGLAVLSHVVVAVGQPETIFDLDVDSPLTLQQCNCSDPVPHFYVIWERWHPFLLNLVAEPV